MGPTGISTLVDRWIQEEAEQSPSTATALGIPGHDDRLADLSAAAHQQREQRDESWLALTQTATTDGENDEIDRELLRSTLVGRQVVRPWRAWQRDPGVYLGACLNGVALLFAHRPSEPAELARCAAARLRQVPDALAQGKANLDPELTSQLIVERSLGQCRAGIAYSRDLVPKEVDDPALQQQLADAGEVASAAYEDFAAHLTALAEKSQGDWALGEEIYSALLIEKEQLGYNTADLRTRGHNAWETIDQQMAEVAARIDKHKTWREVMDDLNADHPSTPEEMRDGYADWTQRARRHLVEHDLVTLPEGEECVVEPAPPFQRPILGVASYLAPAAFSNATIGRFYVPWPPDGASPERVTQLLETNSWWSMPTITAHEAYPGHHWHLTWMKNRAPKLRHVARTPYFTEGWGLYAEHLMPEHGFFEDPRHELCHLDARIFRAARIVVDTSLHTGDMTVDEAITHMTTKASLSETTARAEVGRYCAMPTQAASYLTGCLEIERIRADYINQGKGDVKSFNNAIAATGGLPIGLAERAVIGARR
jgi:uncharacterized protein (DUF885 family)